MSLKTWRQEFYPEPASRARRRSWEWTVRHSLRKWEGVLPKNLRKHDLARNTFFICEKRGKEFALGRATCSLCEKVSSYSPSNFIDCELCPLSAVRVPCGRSGSPWYQATLGDPGGEATVRPLLKALEDALKFVQTHRFNKELLEWEVKDE